MGSALANLLEAKFAEDRNDLLGFQDRQAAHESGDGDILHADKLRLQNRLPILQKHGDDLAQVFGQLVQGLALGVGSRKAGDETDIDPGLRATLDHSGIDAHG